MSCALVMPNSLKAKLIAIFVCRRRWSGRSRVRSLLCRAARTFFGKAAMISSRVEMPSSRKRLSVIGALFIAVFALLLIAPVEALAQSIRPSVEKLSDDLTSLATMYERSADEGVRAQLLKQIAEVAGERKNKLAALMESDPAKVLKLKIAKQHRAALPAAVQPLLEQDVVVVGSLDVFYEDGLRSSVLHHVLKTASGERLSLHFAKGVTRLQTGTRVRVKGLRVQDGLALDG